MGGAYKHAYVRNLYGILVKNAIRDHLEHMGLDGRMIKIDLKKL
jgi:hypothetical protein